MSTQQEKILYSVKAGLLFLIVSLPVTYKLTNMVGTKIGLPYSDEKGCPTMAGLIVHTLVFTLLTYLSMLLIERLRSRSA